ncbi:MAG: rhomboid family intramembrane serine protease [Planctomycetales bacterium]|nr:rhomboid family intramembrane serine protease [Planctomycetales bacterium]
MRQAGVIPDKARAHQFADYLLTRGISTRLDQSAEGWIVWVHDEHFVERSREDLQEFVQNPEAARFLGVSAEATEIRDEQRRREKQYQKNMIDVRRKWQARGSRNIPVTMGILACMVLATLASNFGYNDKVSSWLFIASYTLKDQRTHETISYLPEVMSGQVWRLVTPIFMHGGWLHVIFGLYMFYQFGQLIELRRGPWVLLGMVLAIAVISNLAEYFLADFRDWPNGIVVPAANFLGMSGVIYGLFGYAWIRGRVDPGSGMQLHPNTVAILMIWLVICLVGFMPIANVAHVSGLLVGMAIGYAPAILPGRARRG